MPYVNEKGIFDKKEYDEDVKELDNLESDPMSEVDSVLLERLEFLRWKVDQGRIYLEEHKKI